MISNNLDNQRKTQREKDKYSKQYYRDQADLLDKRTFYSGHLGLDDYGGLSNYKRRKVNYDLFNNIVNIKDFTHVCSPYGEGVGELPAQFTNRDITSGKIKALLGLELSMPFDWKVVAEDNDATSRVEEAEFEKIKEYVISQTMQPIEASLRKKKQEENQGRELNKEEQQQIEQQLQEELQAATPPQVRTYMQRNHQDPAEVLAQQLLTYLIRKVDVERKFNKAFKHGCIEGSEVYWIGEANREMHFNVVNSLYFDYDKSPDVEFIEDGEWATYDMYMTPSQIISFFGDELSNKQIDDIYAAYGNGSAIYDDNFWSFDDADDYHTDNSIRVLHAVWKGLKKIGYVQYVDINGEAQEKKVDENYRLNKEVGDITIEWRWIPEVHQAYKITLSEPIYCKLGPIAGQFKDPDRIFECKLPYMGVAYDNLNSQVTSEIDRIKTYQYYYNIIMYRVELLMASDKGKILLMNLNMVPSSANIDIKKWMYYIESSKIGWMNPNEEGNRGGAGGDIVNAAKAIDMSLASDINQYIQLAELMDRKAGESIGVPKELEAQINNRQAVKNVQQTIAQASNILRSKYELHNSVKRNVLQRMLDIAKVIYSGENSRRLRFALDDMSLSMLELDTNLLANSTYNLYVANAGDAHEARLAIREFAHAAMQTQAVNLSDVVKILKSKGITEAEEELREGEEAKRKEVQQSQMQIEELKAKTQKEKIEFEREKMEFERETKILLEDKKTEREIQKQAILSLGFNEDKDVDKDGKPDILEVAQQGVNAEIQRRKQDLDEKKFEQDKKEHADKQKIEKQKLKGKA